MRVNIVGSSMDERENRATKKHAFEEDGICSVPGKCPARPRRMQFEACLETVRKTCQRFIRILSLQDLCCDLGSVRCTGLVGFFIPPIPEY